MKIVGGLNVNKFYVDEGWTRALIVGLVDNQYNYIDLLRKIELCPITKNDLSCKYFVVYNRRVIFNKERVLKHEYIPFKTVETFGNNNKWI